MIRTAALLTAALALAACDGFKKNPELLEKARERASTLATTMGGRLAVYSEYTASVACDLVVGTSEQPIVLRVYCETDRCRMIERKI